MAEPQGSSTSMRFSRHLLARTMVTTDAFIRKRPCLFTASFQITDLQMATNERPSIWWNCLFREAATSSLKMTR